MVGSSINTHEIFASPIGELIIYRILKHSLGTPDSKTLLGVLGQLNALICTYVFLSVVDVRSGTICLQICKFILCG